MDIYAPPEGAEGKPVMLWVHGGCFTAGGPRLYNGAALVDTGDVVVVIAHYRLGVFGFLGADQLRERDEDHHSTGNYGHLDVIEALKWVRTNIGAFGGDKNNVTIFGQSSGGCSIAGLLAMPDEFTTINGEPLFHGAIMQSGSFSAWGSTPMKVAQD
jgi:para-nitrobenzyl esterase